MENIYIITMKTLKIMKKLHVILIVCLSVLIMPGLLMAQDKKESKEKEVKIKVVKEKDGERTVIDTTLHVQDLMDAEDIEELQELLEANGLGDLDIDIQHIDDMLEDIDVEVLESVSGTGLEKTIVVKKTGEGDDDGEKHVFVTVITSDSAADGNIMKMTMDGTSHSYIIKTGDDEDLEWNEDGEKVMMFTDENGNQTEIVIGSDDLEWNAMGETQVEVVGGEDGKKVIVKNDDGTTREYDLPNEKGTYIIGENGELKKIEEDVTWVDDKEGMKRLTVHVGDDNEALVIMDDGDVIELKDLDDNHMMIFTDENAEEGEQEVFVRVIEKKEGTKTIKIRSKIVVASPDEEDIKAMEKSGIDLAAREEQKLNLEKLVFHPNPSSGKFNLEFITPESTPVQVAIYDINGREVYKEDVKDFDGRYDKEIDISSENSGTYFLKISQGKKMTSRKIILE